MSRLTIGTLSERLRYKAQVVLIDTADMLGVSPEASQSVRCRYVEHLLLDIEYPVTTLPWDNVIDSNLLPIITDQDLAGFYHDLRASLVALSYMGEELIVSPSRGSWVLIHYYKEQP